MENLIKVLKDIKSEFGVFIDVAYPEGSTDNLFPYLKFNNGVEVSAGVYGEVSAPITQAEFDTRMDDAQAEYDAQEYARNRDYPSITDQLDQLYWDKKNNTNTWEEGIDAVKAEFPKGV